MIEQWEIYLEQEKKKEYAGKEYNFTPKKSPFTLTIFFFSLPKFTWQTAHVFANTAMTGIFLNSLEMLGFSLQGLCLKATPSKLNYSTPSVPVVCAKKISSKRN